MKRALLIIALSLPVNNVHATGIPVFDATNMLVWVAELQQWKEQILQATQTVNQLTDTYTALVGITNLEDVITNPLLWEFLPENFMEIYNQGIELGLGSLFTESLNLYNAALSNDVCKRITNPALKTNCYGRQTGGYNMAATSQKVFDNAARRQEQIDRAKSKLKTTELPKDAMALQTAINAEAASAQAELLTLMSIQMAQEANDEMLEQKRSQIAHEVYDIEEPIILDPYVPGSLD